MSLLSLLWCQLNLSSSEAEIFRENSVNTIATDTLAHYVTKSTPVMSWIM